MAKWSGPKIFCIGLPKSGTHSFAAMFREAGARAVHEPDAEEYIRRLLNGEPMDDYLARLLLSWDVVSFSGLYAVAGKLVRLYTDARFVLTVREPASWVQSLISHIEHGRISPMYRRFQELRFPTDHTCPVATKLAYWSSHIKAVIAAVPSERLLVTHISHVTAIEEFCGLPRHTLKAKHEYRRFEKDRSSIGVSADYLEDSIRVHCADTLLLLRRHSLVQKDNAVLHSRID